MATSPKQCLYLVLAYGCVGLGAVGVVVPGLPTTPFLLLGAWAAARGSDRLHRRLHAHRHFGPVLRHWQEQGAVPRRAKLTAVVLLAVSWIVLAVFSSSVVAPIVTGVLFLAVGTFVATRPVPSSVYQEFSRGRS